jgi:hypothetical protein
VTEYVTVKLNRQSVIHALLGYNLSINVAQACFGKTVFGKILSIRDALPPRQLLLSVALEQELWCYEH